MELEERKKKTTKTFLLLHIHSHLLLNIDWWDKKGNRCEGLSLIVGRQKII